MAKQRMLTTEQAGEIVGMTGGTIARYAKRGVFPSATRRGQEWRIPARDVVAWIDAGMPTQVDRGDRDTRPFIVAVRWSHTTDTGAPLSLFPVNGNQQARSMAQRFLCEGIPFDHGNPDHTTIIPGHRIADIEIFPDPEQEDAA